MRFALLTFWLACAMAPPSAHAATWQPSAGHTQIPIWPKGVAAGRPGASPESSGVADKLVAGKPWTWVANVSIPTMTVYSPKGANTGAAVIVFPGGGYQILAIDLEGTEICDWLASRGITAVLLKYRVPNHGPSWDQECGCNRDTRSSMALEDAQRAISLVRHRAAEWHVDPRKIGVIGFSAGGHLVASVSTRFGHRAYSGVDEADRESCRPDFAVALYPGHMLQYRNPTQHKELRVPRDTSPTFIVQAENDNVDAVANSLVYYDALKNAGVPVELHLYAEGGHAFGLRPTRHPITEWPRLAEAWLHTIGVISK